MVGAAEVAPQLIDASEGGDRALDSRWLNHPTGAIRVDALHQVAVQLVGQVVTRARRDRRGVQDGVNVRAHPRLGFGRHGWRTPRLAHRPSMPSAAVANRRQAARPSARARSPATVRV